MENVEVIERNCNEEVIMPFEKKEEFFVEDLGVLKKKPFFSFVKRTADVLVSFFGLLILWFPMLIIAIGVRCTSKGPAFFVQDRLGLNGKKITVIKFRTMCVDAEKRGAQWSRGDKDVRITRFGRFLRKSRIDELPQLFNVFIGDMSLVGPRPEIPHFVEEFKQIIPLYMIKHYVKPGMTGLAQIKGLRGDTSVEKRIREDIDYIDRGYCRSV